MNNGEPIQGRAWSIICIDTKGNKQSLNFYTEEENDRDAFDKYLESLKEQGYKIIRTCIGLSD